MDAISKEADQAPLLDALCDRLDLPHWRTSGFRGYTRKGFTDLELRKLFSLIQIQHSILGIGIGISCAQRIVTFQKSGGLTFL